MLKLPSHRDPIITRTCAKEMSTSGLSPVEENVTKIALLKEQIEEMMHITQQLTEGTRNNTSGPSGSNLNGQAPLPLPNNETMSPNQNTDQNVPPTSLQGTNIEVNPSKDKTLEFGFSQVKS